jgi:hypothetical protein
MTDGVIEVINSCIKELKKHGLEIGKAAQEGNPLALKITQYYVMLKRCQDGMTAVLLEEAIKEWKQSNQLLLQKDLT